MKGIFKLCREYVRAHRKLLTLYIFLCVFLGLQSLASPYITGNFIDSISYNIQLNQDELNAENIIQAIDILGLRDFLNNLPQGLDTFLHENASNISGGEKQKIALLRAIIKNPDVLLLDEPTSALDTITTKRLIEYLISIKEEKIIIVVSHNDEVSQIADKTIWLEGGKQVREGK